MSDGSTLRAPGSFRDPSGYVFEQDGVIYRTVSRSFAPEFDQFMSSGLYDALVDKGYLVPHEEVHHESLDEDVHTVLRPERIRFVSFPYEWCPEQLRQAALLTLKIQEVALEHGMSLRDASAYNVQFQGVEPIFIDTLSFEPARPGGPWVAYGQFCRHFVAPLTLAAYSDPRATDLLRTHIDGIPLDLATSLLPVRTRLRPGLLLHLHMHARSQRSGTSGDGETRQVSFSRNALQGVVDGLRRLVLNLSWAGTETVWSDYYEQADHYSDGSMEHKRQVVRAFLERTGGDTVWDLGANTGRFSRLAAERGADVVAFDADRGAVDTAFRDLRDRPVSQGSVLPLYSDLTNPSPALGWAHGERPSLVGRGPADVVLALALIHHLAIGNNVPLPHVLDFLSRVGRHAIVEFVPKSDQKVGLLLAAREDVFPDYTVAGFERAATQHAKILDQATITGTDRRIYLLAAG